MMNAPAQSMRSPPSPYEQQAKRSFSQQQRPCYPTSPNPESLSTGNAPNRGLGLYPCTLAPSQASINEIAASPHHGGNWPHHSMMQQDYSQPTHPLDSFSPAFDPFSGFGATSNSGMGGVSSPEAPGLEFCQTPPGSNMQSHRSSVSSSYAASESYSQSGSDYAYTPKVKVEEAGEWYPSPGSEHILQRTLSSQGPLAYAPNTTTLPSQTEDLYRPQPSEWSKTDTTGYITELHAHPDARNSRFDVQPILPSVTRIKKKRQRTTPEEATHECRVCGKLFKRSYNWKSHMETHNPERKYPHPCTAMVGNTPCSKKFQRKTDLDRHHDSVHLKARNHKCNLCGNRFARRDTLRRHTEDGCPKRFELGVREASATTPTRWSYPNSFANRPRSYSIGGPQSSPMVPPTSATSTATFPLFRPDYRPMAPISSPAYQS